MPDDNGVQHLVRFDHNVIRVAFSDIQPSSEITPSSIAYSPVIRAAIAKAQRLKLVTKTAVATVNDSAIYDMNTVREAYLTGVRDVLEALSLQEALDNLFGKTDTPKIS